MKISFINKHYIHFLNSFMFLHLRNTFTMHVEAGHNHSAPDEILKDLRCPLCLYHTKHKSNMIDHIVLHRGTHHKHHAQLNLGFIGSVLGNVKVCRELNEKVEPGKKREGVFVCVWHLLNLLN